MYAFWKWGPMGAEFRLFPIDTMDSGHIYSLTSPKYIQPCMLFEAISHWSRVKDVIIDLASHGPHRAHGRRIPLFPTTLHGESSHICVLWIGPSWAEFH
jgi:hypothetical protein